MRAKTTKNTNDLRYHKAEKAIQMAVLDMMAHSCIANFKITEVCRRAGVVKSTFYQHYDNLNAAIIDQERKINLKIANIIKQVNLKHPEDSQQALKELFFRIFLLLHREQTYFNSVLKHRNERNFYYLTTKLKPVFYQHWHNFPTEKLEKIHQICSYEIISILSFWVQGENFEIDKIEQHVNSLVHLTKTACKRIRSDW